MHICTVTFEISGLLKVWQPATHANVHRIGTLKYKEGNGRRRCSVTLLFIHFWACKSVKSHNLFFSFTQGCMLQFPYRGLQWLAVDIYRLDTCTWVYHLDLLYGQWKETELLRCYSSHPEVATKSCSKSIYLPPYQICFQLGQMLVSTAWISKVRRVRFVFPEPQKDIRVQFLSSGYANAFSVQHGQVCFWEKSYRKRCCCFQLKISRYVNEQCHILGNLSNLLSSPGKGKMWREKAGLICASSVCLLLWYKLFQEL